MDFPLQSVCIPAYNHERYIQACLDSVLQQTYPNIELIIIDDGSKDRTYDLAAGFVAEHGGRFTRVELLRQANLGLTGTCNRLLELARGEWIHIIASDDILYPNKVQVQWEATLAWGDDDLALIYGDMDEIDAAGKVLLTHNVNRPQPGPQRRAFEQLLLRNVVFAPTAATRRTAMLEIGGYDATLPIEDLDCWLRLSRKYAIGRVPEVVCGYRIHGANLSQKKPLLLAAHLETHGKFLANFGDEVPSAIQRSCFQKDSHRVLRWAKRYRPGALPRVLFARLASYVSTPAAEEYLSLAQLIRSTL